MKSVLIAKVPDEHQRDDAHYFVMVDRTDDGEGVDVYAMLNKTTWSGWHFTFDDRHISEREMNNSWGIEPYMWTEYEGPVFYYTG